MSARRSARVTGDGARAGAGETSPFFYSEATFGQAQWRRRCPGPASCDDTDWPLRVLAYTLNRIFAAEIGYHNLGKATGAATIKANAGRP